MGLDEFAGSIPRRRLRWAAVAFSAVLVAGVVPGLASGQEEEFVTGSGNAYAQVVRVGPTAARLSLAPIIGLSLADYVGTLGRGEVKAAEWAALGVARSELPDNTPALRVESTQKGSEKGTTEIVVGGTDVGGNGGGLMELHARATDAPLGESRYRLARFGIPGLIEVNEGEAHTTAGIIETAKGRVRQSTSTVEVKSFDFGGGAVTLSGLRWWAVQRTGAEKKVEGSFTIQGASIGGVAIPLPGGGAELGSILGPINTALAPTGFAIRPPEIDTVADVARVSPLSIEIIDSPLGRQFVAPILEAMHPIREPLTDALIEGSEGEFSVAILVADIGVGIVSGSSQLHIEVGGANAFTEGQRFESPFSGVITLPPVVRGDQTVFVPGKPGSPAIPPTEPEEAELAVALPARPGTRTVPGDKGGVAMAVGLIGLVVAAGLAAADWYRMRTARRVTAEG